MFLGQPGEDHFLQRRDGSILQGHIRILSIVVFSCQAPCQASFRPLPLGVKLGRQLVVGKINHAEFRIPSNQALWKVNRGLS